MYNILTFLFKKKNINYKKNFIIQGKVIVSYGCTQGWEPANFLAAPAPDFFFKRLRLLLFFQAAPAPAPGIFLSGFGSKGTKKTGSGLWLLVKFGKIFFSPHTSKVKLQKYKTSKIIVFFNHKNLYTSTILSRLSFCIREKLDTELVNITTSYWTKVYIM